MTHRQGRTAPPQAGWAKREIGATVVVDRPRPSEICVAVLGGPTSFSGRVTSHTAAILLELREYNWRGEVVQEFS